ncbi:MAG: hypothetical protein ACTSPB_20815 [Candidatus Thorarchaeota archaeon]
MGSIVKREFEEHVRYLLLRFPRDLKRVAKEAGEYVGRLVPVEEVVRIRKRFKAHQDKDVSLWVACNLSREILQSSHQRKAKLDAMYEMWDGKEEVEVSLCCKAPVQKLEPMQGAPYFRCLKCDETCSIKVVKDLSLERLKMDILREMRTESELLLRFAKEMGFTASEGPPQQITKNTNFVLVGNSNKSSQSSVSVDAEVAQKIDDMSPVERERVIKQLEKMSEVATPPVDVEFVGQKDLKCEQ